MAQDNIKYAIFWQVNGEWHGGDFYTPTDDTPPEKQIAAMRETCESENGKGTFRSFSFLDQPHKDTRTEAQKFKTESTVGPPPPLDALEADVNV